METTIILGFGRGFRVWGRFGVLGTVWVLGLGEGLGLRGWGNV